MQNNKPSSIKPFKQGHNQRWVGLVRPTEKVGGPTHGQTKKYHVPTLPFLRACIPYFKWPVQIICALPLAHPKIFLSLLQCIQGKNAFYWRDPLDHQKAFFHWCDKWYSMVTITFKIRLGYRCMLTEKWQSRIYWLK